jgi:rare lipoprotein A
MRQLLTSAVLWLALCAAAALPAAAGDHRRAGTVWEWSDAPRAYHEQRAVRHGHHRLAATGRFYGYDDDGWQVRRRASRAWHRGHASHHARHHHVRSAMHHRHGHGVTRHAKRRAPVKDTIARRALPATPKEERTTAAPKAHGQGGQVGVASFYSSPQRVASGGWFNPNALTAAHRTLPFGTHVRVTHRGSGRSVDVTINDRGPYIAGRIIDLSRAAAGAIGMTAQGVAKVTVEVLGRR